MRDRGVSNSTRNHNTLDIRTTWRSSDITCATSSCVKTGVSGKSGSRLLLASKERVLEGMSMLSRFDASSVAPVGCEEEEEEGWLDINDDFKARASDSRTEYEPQS